MDLQVVEFLLIAAPDCVVDAVFLRGQTHGVVLPAGRLRRCGGRDSFEMACSDLVL